MVTGVPGHTELLGLTSMKREGITLVTVVMVIEFMAESGVAHVALLKTVSETTSPSLGVKASVVAVPVGPALLPFTNQWYSGAVPPLISSAVKVTGVPTQTV